jgi:hypothetical protein
MEFQVPQFIEVEDKIFGPFTFKQFIFIIGGGGLGFIIWFLLSPLVGTFFSILPALPAALFIGAFGFNIVHKREKFIQTVENAFKFYKNKKIYIWRKDKKKVKEGDRASDKLGDNDNFDNLMPKLSSSRLKDISWGLDVQEILGDSTQDSLK